MRAEGPPHPRLSSCQNFHGAALSNGWPVIDREGALKKRSTLRKLLALSVLATLPGGARGAGELREGIDYVRVSPPQPQSRPGIEVIEFFSYACPHCNEVEPLVSKWRSTLPKDVTFQRVPVSFGRSS